MNNIDKAKKLYLEADLVVQEETSLLKEKASAYVKLPEAGSKQPDLLYFSAIFVSSGENLNKAYFLGSELVAAKDSVVNKALDLEHIENEIIGHIYDRAYITKDGDIIDIEEASKEEAASLDSKDMHIVIAGIIYKNRFPELAAAVAEKSYKVSMECYYQDFDLKIGDVIMSRVEAQSLGLASTDSAIGKFAKIIKNGKEIASGTVARVLRGISFFGCGIVENPANPPSIILEVANKQEPIILDYSNNVTKDNIDEEKNKPAKNKDVAGDTNIPDNAGICVYYKRFIHNKENAVEKQDWCSAYDKGCTSFSREATDTNCLRYIQINTAAKKCFDNVTKKIKASDNRKALLSDLAKAIKASKKVLK